MEPIYDEQTGKRAPFGRVMSVGCAIITFNEEKNIERTLKSVQFCDQIVVVDSYSTDRTLEIAKKYTPHIYLRQFKNYGEQKNFALSKLSTDWKLSIDADEVIDDELKNEILKVVKKKDNSIDGYYLKIQLVFLGKALRFGGSQNWHLRLFRNNVKFSESMVHEKVSLLKTSYLKGKVLHYSYEDLSDYLEKLNKYTTLSALSKRHKKVYPIARFMFELFKRFVLRAAYLDGYHGSLYALLSSFYHLVKYAKIKEIASK